MEVIVVNGQSIFDVAVQAYGSVLGVFDMIERNEIASPWSTTLPSGTVLEVSGEKIVEPIRSAVKVMKNEDRNYKITAASGQSIWDLAIQEYGSIEGVFILQENNSSVITEFNQSLVGSVLKIQNDVVNKAVYDYYVANKIIPSTMSDKYPEFGGDFAILEFNSDFN